MIYYIKSLSKNVSGGKMPGAKYIEWKNCEHSRVAGRWKLESMCSTRRTCLTSADIHSGGWRRPHRAQNNKILRVEPLCYSAA